MNSYRSEKGIIEGDDSVDYIYHGQMKGYRHQRIENSYERSNETGEPTRLVLERGHKRRTVLSLPRAPVIRGPALQLSPCHGEIDEVNLVLWRWERMYRLNRFESRLKSFFIILEYFFRRKNEIHG